MIVDGCLEAVFWTLGHFFYKLGFPFLMNGYFSDTSVYDKILPNSKLEKVNLINIKGLIILIICYNKVEVTGNDEPQ